MFGQAAGERGKGNVLTHQPGLGEAETDLSGDAGHVGLSQDRADAGGDADPQRVAGGGGPGAVAGGAGLSDQRFGGDREPPARGGHREHPRRTTPLDEGDPELSFQTLDALGQRR